jgi:tetratricopeptide (TPR) repeat protein
MRQFEKAREIVDQGISKQIFDKKEMYLRQGDYLAADGFTIDIDKITASNKYYLAILPELDDADRETFRRIGINYFELKDFAKADPYYKKAMELEPTEVTNYLNYAELKLVLQKPQEVDAIIAGALSRLKNGESDYAISHYLKICALIMMDKDITREMQDFERVLKSTAYNATWSFETFSGWLKSSSLPAPQKEKLVKLTNQMTDWAN